MINEDIHLKHLNSHSEKRDFDKVAAAWDQEPGRVKLANDVSKAITNAIKLDSNMDVLDFGCGTGLLTIQLQPLVRSITGIDGSQGMLDVLKAKIKSQNLSNVKTRHVDFEKGDVLEGSYDVIVSSMTLHHIKETKPLLGQFYRMLAPSGHLCIADLDPDDGQFHSNNDGVFHFGFNQTTLRHAFAEAGFADIGYRTAASVLKSTAGGGQRVFTVFLVTGKK